MTSEDKLLSAERGVNAVLDMARRRNLHAARHEAERAWQEVSVSDEADRLGAVWRWLFAGHSITSTPQALLSNSQLPAWCLRQSCIGVITRVGTDEAPAEIEWIDGQVPTDAGTDTTVLIPLPPRTNETEPYLPEPEQGIATRAIKLAMRAHRPVFIRAGIASLVINLVAVVTALFAMLVYDRVVPNNAVSTLWFLASGVILAFVLDFTLKIARLRLMEASERRLDEALSQYVFDSVLALKIDRRPQHLGALVAQVRDYEAVKAFFTASTLFTLSEVPFVIIFITIIALIGGPVAWVPGVFVIACLIVGLAAYKPLAKLQRQHNEASVRRQGLLFEAVAGGESIKGLGAEARFGDDWLDSTRDTGKRNEDLRTFDGVMMSITQFFQQTSSAGILIVGVYVIAAGNMTLGGLIACMILGGRLLNAISGIPKLLLRWHHARYSLQILNQLLASPSDDNPERQANTHAAPLHINVRDLQYAYGSATEPQLSVPKMSIRQGERIAVVGRSGSGKSTLLRLLAGVATPSAGQVSIAELDYEHCRPSWLRETVGYLPQELRLFSGSLLDNLTLGLSLPSEEEIQHAMAQTGLDRIIRGHPEGLQFKINEGGSGLSGGQRQLLVMTRLFLQKPKIWVLDEPSGCLDGEAEVHMMNMLRALPADCTVIFSTHRTNWLELADRVVMMDDGAIRFDEPREKIKATSRATEAQ